LWFKAAALPGLVCLFVLPLVVYFVYPPDLKHFDNKSIADQGRAQLGPVSWEERLLALFFVTAIALWATGSWTGIDATAVALALVAATLLTGIIDWNKIAVNQGAWSTLMWYGGIVGIADGLAKAKFFDWFAKLLAANVNFDGYNAVLVMAALAVLCLILHYLFASLAAFITAILPVLFTLALIAKTPVYATFFLIAFATDYGASLTHFGGALGPVLFGERYVDQKSWWMIGAIVCAVSLVIHLTLGLPYWKWLGLW
jgi:DASS family divalent anion:Na+ symporter